MMAANPNTDGILSWFLVNAVILFGNRPAVRTWMTTPWGVGGAGVGGAGGNESPLPTMPLQSVTFQSSHLPPLSRPAPMFHQWDFVSRTTVEIQEDKHRKEKHINRTLQRVVLCVCVCVYVPVLRNRCKALPKTWHFQSAHRQAFPSLCVTNTDECVCVCVCVRLLCFTRVLSESFGGKMNVCLTCFPLSVSLDWGKRVFPSPTHTSHRYVRRQKSLLSKLLFSTAI